MEDLKNVKTLSLKEIQNVELEMLKKFSDFCEEKGFRYILTYGTLLGAARHQGFVPWDDDVDVMLLRDDYNKLIEYYESGEAIEGLELLYHTKDNEYYYPFAKLCDENTVAKMLSSVTKHGIWIDLFPVDKIPEKPTIAKRIQKRMIFNRQVIIACTTDFKNRKFDWKTIPKIILSIYGKILGGGKTLVNKMERDAQKYNNTNNTTICHLAWQAVLGGILTEEDFNDRIKIPFEKYEFYAPKCYDKFLRDLYGDYTILPPENKRRTHGLIAYYKPENK